MVAGRLRVIDVADVAKSRRVSGVDEGRDESRMTTTKEHVVALS